MDGKIVTEKKGFSLSEFFISKSKVAFLFGIAIFLLGIASYNTIKKESAPEIKFGIIVVSTSYTGVSAEDIDSQITEKIESKIKSLSDISDYTSRSVNGLSSITINLDPEADITKALSDVRSKVDEAKRDLPTDLDSDPLITEIDSSRNSPLIKIALYADKEPYLLSQSAEKLKKKLENISGVDTVDVAGKIDTEIVVDIDKQKLEAFNISLSEVSSALSSANRDVPVGTFELGDTEYNLRFSGKFKTTEDVKNTVIKPLSFNEDNIPVLTIAQIADVYEGSTQKNDISRYGDAEKGVFNSVVLTVYRSGGEDIFAIEKRVLDTVESLKDEDFLEGINIDFLQRLSITMQEDFDNVVNSALISVAIVMLLVFFFVGVREGMIAALVIPLAVLATVFVLFLRGDTLNFMTNFSMVLAIGILVDTAVVIVEGVHKYIKEGMTPKQAAKKTIKEFGPPLVSGMLTTLVVFIPLFSLPGILGKFLSYIPITISIILICSLFISIFLISSYAGTLLPSHSDRIKKKSFFFSIRKRINSFLDAIINQYGRIANLVLSSKILAVGIFISAFVAFFFSSKLPIPFELFPDNDSPSINISIEKNIGTPTDKTMEVVAGIENILLQYPEVKAVTSNTSDNTASIYTELLPIEERKLLKMKTAKVLEKEIQKQMENFSNVDIRVQLQAEGPPSEFPVGFRVIAADINDLEVAKTVTRDLTELLRNEPGSQGVKNNILETPGEFEFRIKRDKVLKMGIPIDSVAAVVRTAINGTTATTITRDGEDIDIVIQLKENNLESIEDVLSIKMSNAVPLSELIDISQKNSLSQVSRNDGQIAFTVSSLLDENSNAQEITNSVLQKIEVGEISIPENISIKNASENAENAELFGALTVGGILAILMIFIILVIQFNSFSQPLLILQTIVFALIGVFVGLYLTGTTMSLAFILGIIALFGIVVNDAIIMVDKMNKNIRLGNFDSRKQAIVEAGKSRFIPVILTTLTTSAGIVPLIFIDTFWAGLSYTVIFGLSLASFLTLFLIPIGYTLFWGKQKMNRPTFTTTD